MVDGAQCCMGAPNSDDNCTMKAEPLAAGHRFEPVGNFAATGIAKEAR